MNLVRCDVHGCLAEFEVVSHEGPIPAGWRRESKLRVMLVPREALPPLPPGVLLCPLPPILKATVAVSAIVCPAHPADAALPELRENCFRPTPDPPFPLFLIPVG
jgi:hypothetical protein